MKRFPHWSLRNKLIALITVASSAGLLFTMLSIVLNELRTFPPQARQTLTTAAGTIGFHAAAAIVFEDDEDARHTLDSLRMSEDVVAAALYDHNGRRVAAYGRPGASPGAVPERPGADGARFIGRHMAVVEPVMHEGERVGTIYLESDLRQLYGHLYRYAGAAALVTLVGLGVSLFASAFLSRLVTRPIHELGRVAANVTSRKDFSLRATKQTHDEIGMLIDAFNDMLARIQERDEALLGVQSDLEVRVRERTAELETINRSLSEEVATRKAIEAQLIDARDHAEAASRAKSTFLANMSHDLRTPLTAVLGYSEMLQEEAQERKDAQSVKDLDCIRNAANHLLSLLSDLLDLSRIEVGRMELQPEFIDLFSFIEEFESTSRPMCEPNHNRLTVWCAPDLREMVTDRTRLRQILYNLVSNATKFTKRGEITLTAERRRRGDAERICFSVRDTGIGMTQEQLSRIFEPFMQGESNTPLMYGGSGLGLAICQRCCELMEGTIDATSTPGKGTTLEVEFPVRIGKTRHTPTKLPDGAA